MRDHQLKGRFEVDERMSLWRPIFAVTFLFCDPPSLIGNALLAFGDATVDQFQISECARLNPSYSARAQAWPSAE